MRLSKLYTPEEEHRIGNEMYRLYWEEGYTQRQLKDLYEISYDTLNEFLDKYHLRKKPDQYNRKNIDKRFSEKQQLDLAENLKRDFLERYIQVPELLDKYEITISDWQNLRKKFNIVETPETHWERTQRANERKHGVRHMSHIEGHSQKSLETFQKHYRPGSDVFERLIRTQYENLSDKHCDFETFRKARCAFQDGDLLKQLLEDIEPKRRNYQYLGYIWNCSETTLQAAVENHNLVELISKFNISFRELLVNDYIIAALPNSEIVFNDRVAIKPFEIDIYISQYKFGIEVNGDYFHSDLYGSPLRHQNKSKLCYDTGIQLYHIDCIDDIKTESERAVNLLRNHSYDMSKDELTLNFGKDNGVWLKQFGYQLVNVTAPRIIDTISGGNIYDAGDAVFRKQSH